MRKTGITVTAIFLCLIGIAFFVFVNDIVISLRLTELRASLHEMDRSESSIDHVSLVATYEVRKKLFEKRIDQDEADAIEQKINYLSVSKKDTQPSLSLIYNLVSLPALKVINFNRRVLGKKPLLEQRIDDQDFITMDLAYYYERNFHFKRAIELYDKNLANKNLADSLKASILLHQGYCYALSGNNDKARRKYLKILEKYSQENSAITAIILLKYLEGFHLARQRVLKSSVDPIAKGQDLVNLLAYKQALAILEDAEKEAKAGDIVRIKYFKARCFAGIGETGKSIENYFDVITSEPYSKYARYSNRKLYMIGTSTGKDDIQKVSVELNEKLHDPVLTEMIEGGSKSAMAGRAHDLIEADVPTDTSEKVTELLSDDTFRFLKKGEYLVIFTNDGNTFKGALLDQSKDYIVLKSSIGIIKVKRDRIIRISGK